VIRITLELIKKQKSRYVATDKGNLLNHAQTKIEKTFPGIQTQKQLCNVIYCTLHNRSMFRNQSINQEIFHSVYYKTQTMS